MRPARRQLVHAEYLSHILDQFGQSPMAARKALRSAWESATPSEFRSWIAPALETSDAGAQRFLLSFLLQNAHLIRSLGEQTSFTREEALTIARAAHKVDPSLDVKLAMQIATHSVPDERDARRILEILEAISKPGNLLPMLSSIMQHPDVKVRSKAALLMGKGNRNPQWLHQQLGEPDDRVRANAVEALWGLDTAEASHVFRIATKDRSPRTSVNAMLGLYLCGHAESVTILANSACSADASLRTSAAWGMGKTQDPRFAAILPALVRDRESSVRSNALKALSRIRAYRTMLEHQPQLPLRIGGAQVDTDGSRVIRGVVRLPPAYPRITPVSFAVEEDTLPIVDYTVSFPAQPDAAVGIAWPFDAEPCGPVSAALPWWRQMLLEKPVGDCWAVAGFRNEHAAKVPNQPVFSNQLDVIEKQAAAFSSAPYAGFFPALNGLLFNLPARSSRALVVVGSTAGEPDSLVAQRQSQIERFVREANRAEVKVHAIIPPVCPPIARVSLMEITSGTGGDYREAENADQFSRLVAATVLCLFPSFELRYPFASGGKGNRIALTVHCPQGIGLSSATL